MAEQAVGSMLGARIGVEAGNMDVPTAISAYLDRANGDTRLALAYSVADSLAAARLVAANVRVRSPRTQGPSLSLR